jgi:hypothetical protein
MCCRNWGRAISLAIICLAVLPGAALGEEQPAAQPTAGAVEEVTEEAPAAAGSPATTAPVEKAEEILQIDVLAHKEKAATSSVVTKDDIRNGPYMNLPGYLEELSGIDMSRLVIPESQKPSDETPGL